MFSITVKGDRLAIECLDDEVRNYLPIIWMHTRVVGIKNVRNLDTWLVLATVVSGDGCLAKVFQQTRCKSDRRRSESTGSVLGLTDAPLRARLLSRRPGNIDPSDAEPR